MIPAYRRREALVTQRNASKELERREAANQRREDRKLWINVGAQIIAIVVAVILLHQLIATQNQLQEA